MGQLSIISGHSCVSKLQVYIFTTEHPSVSRLQVYEGHFSVRIRFTCVWNSPTNTIIVLLVGQEMEVYK